MIPHQKFTISKIKQYNKHCATKIDWRNFFTFFLDKIVGFFSKFRISLACCLRFHWLSHIVSRFSFFSALLLILTTIELQNKTDPLRSSSCSKRRINLFQSQGYAQINGFRHVRQFVGDMKKHVVRCSRKKDVYICGDSCWKTSSFVRSRHMSAASYSSFCVRTIIAPSELQGNSAKMSREVR